MEGYPAAVETLQVRQNQQAQGSHRKYLETGHSSLHKVSLIITARVRSTREGNIYTWKCLSVHFWGGIPGPGPGGGVRGPCRGGPRSRSRWGGTWSQVQGGGGYLVSGLGGGIPSFSKGKKFWHQIWLDTCSDWQKNFLSRDPSPQ